jgi:hypothetical protein
LENDHKFRERLSTSTIVETENFSLK